MPVSKLRKNRKPNAKRLTAADSATITRAYNRKFDEYDAMPVEELKVLHDSRTVKGTYLVALDEVIRRKSISKIIGAVNNTVPASE